MTTHFLVDRSAYARIRRAPEVAVAFEALLAADDVLASCSVTQDEAAFSARNVADLTRIRRTFAEEYVEYPSDDDTDAAVHAIRDALTARGQGRGAQTTDVLIAAVAVRWDLTVLHYDRDFELIADCYPAFRQQWVVPRAASPDAAPRPRQTK